MSLAMSEPAKHPFIDRYELSRLLDISVHSVAANETRLGIAPARVNLNSRMVRYHRTIALRGLEKSGHLPKTDWEK